MFLQPLSPKIPLTSRLNQISYNIHARHQAEHKPKIKAQIKC